MNDNTEPFFNTAFSIDLLIVTVRSGGLEVLLIKRTEGPWAGAWSLPGKLVGPQETTEAALSDLFYSLTGHQDIQRYPMGTFTGLHRHPEGRVITVTEYAPVRPCMELNAREDAPESQWFPLLEVPELPFDHNLIINSILEQIRKDSVLHPLLFDLVPEKFTLTEIQDAFEAVYAESYDKRNFARRAKSSPLLRELKEKRKPAHGPGRWAQLYAFEPENFEKRYVNKTGFNF